jgi:hypothetical protein
MITHCGPVVGRTPQMSSHSHTLDPFLPSPVLELETSEESIPTVMFLQGSLTWRFFKVKMLKLNFPIIVNIY